MTQVVLFMGDALRNYWWLMLVAVALVVLVAQRRLRDPEVRYRVDRWLVTGPVVGTLFSRIEMARFSRTLGTLLVNGVTLVAALNIVRETMGNAWLAEAVGDVARELKEGRGLGRPMMETGRFPMLAVHMIHGRRGDRAPRRHADAGGRDLRPRGRGRDPQGARPPAARDDRAHGARSSASSSSRSSPR